MTEQIDLTADTVIAQGEDQVSTVVDGETVLMNVGTGKYYKLDDIGSRIWALIETPISVGALRDQLLEEFEVERATCETDTLDWLNRLLNNNLIRIVQK